MNIVVRDAAGAPVPGAIIALRDGSGLITTDSDGFAQLTVSGEKIEAVVSSKALGDFDVATVIPEDSNELNIVLSDESAAAAKGRAPAKMQNIADRWHDLHKVGGPRNADLRVPANHDGGGVAGGIPVSCASGVYCQLPTLTSRQSGIGAGFVLAATSDRDPGFGFLVADNVESSAAGSLSTLCWWGIYRNFGLGVDCAPGSAPDAFEVVIYNNDAGGAVPGTIKAGPLPVAVTAKFPTGNSIIGIQAEYQFEGTIAPVAVAAGECIWIEISNNAAGTGCAWLWDSAEPGDGRGAQAVGGAYAPTDYDLALCVNIAAATCPGPPPVGNDDCSTAEAITTIPSSTPGTTAGAAASGTVSCAGPGATSPDVWYTVTGTGNTITASLCGGATWDTVLNVYCGSCTTLICVTGIDDACGLQSEVSWCSEAGRTYFIRVSGFGSASGAFTLNLSDDGVGCTPTIDCSGNPPANDSCATPQAISGEGTFNFSTALATTDGLPHASCLSFGTDQIENDVWFCWTSPCTADVRIETCGLTTVDTRIAVYNGCVACPPTDGDKLACNDDSCGLQSRLTFPAVSGQTYMIRVGNFPGALGGAIGMTIDCIVSEQICFQPSGNCQAFDTSNASNSTAGIFTTADDFTPAVSGNVTDICWWGAYLPGLAADSFRVCYYADAGGFPGALIACFQQGVDLAVAGPADTGQLVAGIAPIYEYTGTHAAVPVAAGTCYWIEIVNAPPAGTSWFWEWSFGGNLRAVQSGGVITNDLAFCVNVGLGNPGICLPPPPGNDSCSTPDAISGEGTFGFDNSAATTDGLPHASCLAFGLDQIENDVWYCWTAPCNGPVRIETCGLTTVDTRIAVYTGCTVCPPTDVEKLACNDDTCGLQSRVEFVAVSGQTYMIRLGTFPGATGGLGSFSVTCLPPPPANDNCANAITVAIPSSTAGNTSTATADPSAPTCVTTVTAPGVWYRVIGDGTTLTATTCNDNTGYDTKINVYCGTCTALTCITGNDDGGDESCDCPSCGGSNWESRASWCSQAGAPYYILVQGFGGGTGPFQLDVSSNGISCTATIECLPTGACCLAGDVCVVTTSVACAAQNGDYAGDGVPCSLPGGSPITYTFDSNLALVDGPFGSVSDTRNVPDSRIMGDVNIGVQINHTWVGDLLVDVTHVNSGTTVRVIERMGLAGGAACDSCCGCSADNLNVTLDDEAAAPIETQCLLNLTGTFRPFALLSGFDGLNSNSDWTITVCDGAGGDVGTLVRWSITTELAGEDTCPLCPGDRGDTNCDGSVDFFDIDPFLLALFNPASYAATYCGGETCTVDIDCSGNVDFFDIDPFLVCLFSGTGCAACP